MALVDFQCSAQNCGNKTHARKLCANHYAKWLSSTPKESRPRNLPLVDQLLSRVVAGPKNCWIWTGKKVAGYGHFRGKYAHRLVYSAIVGQIPPGLSLDHLCRNTRCVNPDHLDPVTHKENVRRGNVGKIESSRTHCPSGHEYTEENTYRNRLNGSRSCRACVKSRHAAENEKRKDKRKRLKNNE